MYVCVGCHCALSLSQRASAAAKANFRLKACGNLHRAIAAIAQTMFARKWPAGARAIAALVQLLPISMAGCVCVCACAEWDRQTESEISGQLFRAARRPAGLPNPPPAAPQSLCLTFSH